MTIKHFHLEKIKATEDEETRTYQLTYHIHTTNKEDGPLTIHADASFPYAIGDYYRYGNDEDPDALCTDVATDPIDGHLRDWISVLNFTTDRGNPFDEPASYEWLFNSGEKAIERDIHGKPIQNTAGDRFDEILTREDSQPVLKVTRFEPASNVFFGYDLRDSVNRSGWLGAPRRTVKFQPPRAVSQYSKKYGLYYQKSYEFKFSDQTWKLIMLNQGLNELKTSGTGASAKKQRVRMKDGEGNDITEPYALDKAGIKLADGKPPVWVEFDGYPEVNFPNF